MDAAQLQSLADTANTKNVREGHVFVPIYAATWEGAGYIIFAVVPPTLDQLRGYIEVEKKHRLETVTTELERADGKGLIVTQRFCIHPQAHLVEEHATPTWIPDVRIVLDAYCAQVGIEPEVVQFLQTSITNERFSDALRHAKLARRQSSMPCPCHSK